MTETQERYVLQNCPLVVDPAAASLEVKASLQRAGVAPTADRQAGWLQLQRVQVRHDTFGFGLDSSMVHFFGPAARADDCPFLLAYDATGRLRHRIDKEGAEFVASRLPEETNGRPVAKPSVRLTFDDLDHAQLFLGIVDVIRGGGPVPLAAGDFVRDLIGRASDVVFTHVAKK